MAFLKSTDFHPTVFKDDIIINLKGKVTTEDSMVVKDIIKDFQKAIPHLKISLSNSPGNLILGLDFNKMHSITSNFNLFEAQSRKVQFSLPDNLTSFQRKQAIYYWLFKGLFSFNYNNSSVNILGMKGCVFCENDFDSITFSPFDLFILEKLYAPDFSILLTKNLDLASQQLAWKCIQSKFIDGLHDPRILQGNISIKLTGNFTRQDSLILNNLTNELNEIIPSNSKLFFTNSDARLTFTMNSFGRTFHETNSINYSGILFRNLYIGIPKGIDDENRLKIFYYYLYRSLVYISQDNKEGQTVEGCVFDESNPENIGFHPYDKFIISKLYAPDFLEQFKADFIDTTSRKEYYKSRVHDQLPIVGNVGSLILCILLVSILILLNVFHNHHWKFRSYLIQVIWIIIVFNVFPLFYYIVLSFSFDFSGLEINAIIAADLIILIFSIVIFLIEKKIKFSILSSRTKFMLLMTNTLFMSYLAVYLLLHYYTKHSGLYLVFLCIFTTLIITTARFFIISLSVLSSAEIKQKDNELILLKEKSKQAELDSLRAKINPHFLYNALNSIASLATTDARKTEQMALALSDFFKYAINREQKQLNTLSEELNAIRTHLEIEKVRLGDRLSFEIDCPAELLDIQIPQLLIQPLVENAIKHGLSQITQNGLIGIFVSKEENQLKIRVYDNGPAFPDGPLSGFGIQNTQERIALLYGAKASINWQNGAEKYIEINIPIGN